MSQEDTMLLVAGFVDSGQKARWPVCAIASGIAVRAQPVDANRR
jgi:hypothetical protein